MADVSIIIPAYNRLWCLPRAVQSCRNTTCNTQIIVVDDGSTDGTWEWLQTQTDVTAIRQGNKGQTYAINKGFDVAGGKYIRFLDSDDFLTEGIIDKQYNAAIETGAQLICSRVDFFDDKTGTITINPKITDWKDFLEIQLGNKYGSHFLGMLFDRELIEKVPRRPDYAYREDRMFLLEVGLLEPKMAIVEGCGGYWVQHAGQMQGNYSGLKLQVTNWQHLNIYKYILRELEQTGRLTRSRKEAACEILWLLATWLAQSHLKEAEDIYNWIRQLCPDFKIPERGTKGRLYNALGFSFTQKLLHIVRFIKYGWK
jgi:glycosyltransferase involved in cell wall biosynthesis